MTHAQAIAERKARSTVRRRATINWDGVDLNGSPKAIAAQLNCSTKAVYNRRRRGPSTRGRGRPRFEHPNGNRTKPRTAMLTPAEIEQLRNLYPGKSLGWIIRNTALLPFADHEKAQFIERVTE